MLRRLLTVVAFASLVTLAAPTARVFACTCMQMTPAMALANADVAFVGVVAGIADAKGGQPVIGSGDPIVYTFAVEESVKGLAGDKLVVTSARDGASCGIVFARAERWRVYANTDDAGAFHTSICSGNELLAEGVPLPTPTTGPPPTALLLAIGAAVIVAAISAWAFTRRGRAASA